MTRPGTVYTGPELCALSARDVVAKLKAGEVTPDECLDAAFQRIGEVEPAINAIPTLCEDRARAAVKQLGADANRFGDYDGWLAGLPVTIKDLNNVAGIRTTFGNVGLKDFVPEVSDPLVEIMEGHGALVIGKSNTPEFGAGANTYNDVFGRTRNPWDTRMNPAGSSGGAAAALATGECWLAHGSDYGGSLRTPAAYCGVVGLRPTPGRCGGGGAMAGFEREGVSGPMARDVGDLALCLDAMAGFDARAPITLEKPRESFQAALARADHKVRIGFAPDLNGFAPVEGEIRDAMAAAMSAVEKAGGLVEETCPELPKLYETFSTLRGSAFATSNPRLPAEVQKHFKATIRENTALGQALSAQDIFDAMADRTVIYNNMRMFLDRFDVLACPVAGLAPLESEIEWPREVDGVAMADYTDWLRFAYLATVAMLPAISVPIGFTPSGMPVGLQLIGPARGEAKVLQVARAVEDAVGFGAGVIDPIVKG